MSEAEKDKGIDEIMKMNIPPEDKVHFIADLCKHRGKCMDEDAIIMKSQNDTIRDQLNLIKRMNSQLHVRSPWDNFKIWMNGWAKS
jgi:hypothetical protein